MKKFFSMLLLGMQLIASIAQAKVPQLNQVTLMTGSDILHQALSHITMTNRTATPLIISGLYIEDLAFSTAADTCADAQSVINGADAAGSLASLVPFSKGQSIPIGQNYLYNMIYTAIYYTAVNSGMAPCKLPGCSWSTDSIPAHWCINIGAISPDASYTYSHFTTAPSGIPSSTLPYGWPLHGESSNYPYNYDLVANYSSYHYIGPITCNDQTLTCSVATPQDQAFSDG